MYVPYNSEHAFTSDTARYMTVWAHVCTTHHIPPQYRSHQHQQQSMLVQHQHVHRRLPSAEVCAITNMSMSKIINVMSIYLTSPHIHITTHADVSCNHIQISTPCCIVHFLRGRYLLSHQYTRYRSQIPHDRSAGLHALVYVQATYSHSRPAYAGSGAYRSIHLSEEGTDCNSASADWLDYKNIRSGVTCNRSTSAQEDSQTHQSIRSLAMRSRGSPAQSHCEHSWTWTSSTLADWLHHEFADSETALQHVQAQSTPDAGCKASQHYNVQIHRPVRHAQSAAIKSYARYT